MKYTPLEFLNSTDLRERKRLLAVYKFADIVILTYFYCLTTET